MKKWNFGFGSELTGSQSTKGKTLFLIFIIHHKTENLNAAGISVLGTGKPRKDSLPLLELSLLKIVFQFVWATSVRVFYCLHLYE